MNNPNDSLSRGRPSLFAGAGCFSEQPPSIRPSRQLQRMARPTTTPPTSWPSLSPAARKLAPALYQALLAASAAIGSGNRMRARSNSSLHHRFHTTNGSGSSIWRSSIPTACSLWITSVALGLVAGALWVGQTRLIDNVRCDPQTCNLQREMYDTQARASRSDSARYRLRQPFRNRQSTPERDRSQGFDRGRWPQGRTSHADRTSNRLHGRCRRGSRCKRAECRNEVELLAHVRPTFSIR